MEITNSISGIALTLFGLILTAMVGGIVQIYKVRLEAREARNEASQANIEATKARQNTTNIGNGFAGDVGRKLEFIVKATMENSSAIRELSAAQREHLSWHVDNPPSERVRK